jgi:hypothetical protein
MGWATISRLALITDGCCERPFPPATSRNGPALGGIRCSGRIPADVMDEGPPAASESNISFSFEVVLSTGAACVEQSGVAI